MMRTFAQRAAGSTMRSSVQRSPGRWLPLALALLLGACAAPIRVTPLDTQSVHRELTRNALSTGEPSAFTRIVLNRTGLSDRFREEPEAALRALHGALVSGGQANSRSFLFALAELSFLYAGGDSPREAQRAHYLAVAVYAYAYLFPSAESAPSPFDPRFRDACDLYNRALTKALLPSTGTVVTFEGGVWRLPFGMLEVTFDPKQLTWIDRQLADFVPLADVEVRGLRDRHRRPGIGAPFAASAPAVASQEGLVVAPRLKIPVTALLRIERPRQALLSDRLAARLELYVTTEVESVLIAEREVPLEAEPTAAVALMLGESAVWDWELGGFFWGDFLPRQVGTTQLFALEPYRPGRIPVVLVHGTASSPARWAEMLNRLENDPQLRRRYQFWLFAYETGNPLLYSAMRLREALERARTTMDPCGADPALRRMVIIGHSQGGLLSKLMTVELEAQVRALVSLTAEVEYRVGEETREHLRRMTAIHPLPFVRRVIFLATPHRGSYIAGNWLVHQLARLVRLPGDLLRGAGELLMADPRLAQRLGGDFSSVSGMTPGSPVVTVLAQAPLAPWITGHSIIAVRGAGPLAAETDGIVAYSSAHLEGMASELVVRSGHSVQQHPAAIEEVRRILLKHLDAP